MSVSSIMLIEDDAIIAAGTKRNLENLGYDIRPIEASAEDALKKIEEEPPDLIVTDIMLSSKMTGIEKVT